MTRYTRWQTPTGRKFQCWQRRPGFLLFTSTYFVETGGGLMSYGPNTSALIAHAAHFLDKILKGASPAELPVEQPTKFEFILNLKTAKALGLAIPDTIVLLADTVIE